MFTPTGLRPAPRPQIGRRLSPQIFPRFPQVSHFFQHSCLYQQSPYLTRDSERRHVVSTCYRKPRSSWPLPIASSLCRSYLPRGLRSCPGPPDSSHVQTQSYGYGPSTFGHSAISSARRRFRLSLDFMIFLEIFSFVDERSVVYKEAELLLDVDQKTYIQPDCFKSLHINNHVQVLSRAPSGQDCSSYALAGPHGGGTV